MIKLHWTTGHPLPDDDARDKLFKMMEYKVFTDMALLADMKLYPCHKIVVACASPYVHEVMQMQLRTDSSKRLVVAIGDFKREQMQQLLEYLYLGTVLVHPESFILLKKLANKLLITLHVDANYDPSLMKDNLLNTVDNHKINVPDGKTDGEPASDKSVETNKPVQTSKSILPCLPAITSEEPIPTVTTKINATTRAEKPKPHNDRTIKRVKTKIPGLLKSKPSSWNNGKESSTVAPRARAMKRLEEAPVPILDKSVNTSKLLPGSPAQAEEDPITTATTKIDLTKTDKPKRLKRVKRVPDKTTKRVKLEAVKRLRSNSLDNSWKSSAVVPRSKKRKGCRPPPPPTKSEEETSRPQTPQEPNSIIADSPDAYDFDPVTEDAAVTGRPKRGAYLRARNLMAEWNPYLK